MSYIRASIIIGVALADLITVLFNEQINASMHGLTIGLLLILSIEELSSHVGGKQ